MPTQAREIPAVVAGPILRRTTRHRVAFWIAARAPAQVRVSLVAGDGITRSVEMDGHHPGLSRLRAGQNLCYLFIDLELDAALPVDSWVDYRIELRMEDDPEAGWQGHESWAEDLCFAGRRSPGFLIPERVGSLLHGSCRKPHHPGTDGLAEAERYVRDLLGGREGAAAWPSMLVMSGDQIYADDVAGPLLRAIHRLIEKTGIFGESLSGLGTRQFQHSRELAAHPGCYYRRAQLLPRTPRNRTLREVLFAGVRKPVFTSDNANNHLITLGEYLAMYLLVWSPVPWQLIDLDEPEGLTATELDEYRHERQVLSEFAGMLPAVRRLLAHVPSAMVFDDHDISDDWNLNRDWEEVVYDHPFSRRMVGNGLLAYFVNQGWGNAPEQFSRDFIARAGQVLQEPGSSGHDAFVQELLKLACWDYQWTTNPPLVVLDTRTRRWRSETSAHKPSGLIDWEALTDLQQQLRGKDAVVLVSAAPIFGVKLIEVIQRLFTWAGHPLLVDAENWMAHPGTGNGILNVFRHRNTPRHFVVLSGDVHYSFVYDVELRGPTRGPDIWQICSSGIRNRFPPRLLDILDRANRILYSPGSPLNWLTKRRRMRIIPRKPHGSRPGRRLLNEPGMGLVELDDEGRPWRIRQLIADGRAVEFERREEESRWD